MNDFATLFNTNLLSGQEFGGLHFEKIRLVATSVETFLEYTYPKQLIVTPATREDVVIALIRKKMAHHGLILTGQREPSRFLKKEIMNANLPTIYAPFPSYEAMCMITSYTAKIRKEDQEKIAHAISLIENNINFNSI
jgi:BioD-like phosphotransacetylase family protein